MKILFGILGLLFGAGLDDESGAIFGLAIGVLTGALIQYRDKINRLEKSLERLQNRFNLQISPSSVEKQTVESEQFDTEPAKDTPQSEWNENEEDAHEILPDPNFVPATNIQSNTATTKEPLASEEAVSDSPSVIDQIIGSIKAFFTTGNIVVKVAVIILFFGVSFLIKYASEKNLLSIELRLLGVSVFGIILLLIGWRLRLKNSLYALVVQGGAIGLLYLTIYGAGRYAVIPMPLAFALLFALVIFACFLAVKQGSKSLAQFATIGGFLAPILTSTGSGNHVALFTYYAVLNLGIFIIAWFKSWRSLNWIGFVFTFVIASLWGFKYYDSQYFSSTQPFLILFFIFYVAISILFSLRQPPKLKGIVDGSLVFGVPLVGFALQSRLVDEFEYGHAWSTLILGIVYLVLNRLIKSKKIPNLNSLSEAFLALAIIFLTLTIPFTFDGNWTAAAWALEGAGILWVGLRQDQKLAKWFGLGLQLLAAIVFFLRNEYISSEDTLFDSFYLGSVMINLAGLFSSYQYSLKQRLSSTIESALPKVLFYWGLAWWLGVHFYKFEHILNTDIQINISVLFVTVSFLVLALIAQKLDWKFPEKNAVFFLPILICCMFFYYVIQFKNNPFDNYGWLSWPLATLVSYLFLYRNELKWDKHLLQIYHSGNLYLIIFIATWFVHDICKSYFTDYDSIHYLLWGMVPAACLFVLLKLRDTSLWPMNNHKSSYLSGGLIPIVGFISIWFFISSSKISATEIFKYLPILNLQDVTLLAVLGLMLYWVRLWNTKQLEKPSLINKAFAYTVIGFLGFIWLNSMVAHSVHYYAGVQYRLFSMMRSDIYQSSISIVWTLTAFVIMVFASKKLMRNLWFVGAALLGMVILKLFTIDMNDSGTLTRIVSFIGVAVLMLVLSYFSPTPPKLEKA